MLMTLLFIVKTWKGSSRLVGLAEIFGRLRQVRMSLNANKCVFGVNIGKFLGHVVSHRGIEANSEKMAAIAKIKQPITIKQQLLQYTTLLKHLEAVTSLSVLAP